MSYYGILLPTIVISVVGCLYFGYRIWKNKPRWRYFYFPLLEDYDESQGRGRYNVRYCEKHKVVQFFIWDGVHEKLPFLPAFLSRTWYPSYWGTINDFVEKTINLETLKNELVIL